ncbi:probable carboxylesterase 9 [Pistacia vera]|uniref:probable carboxylesterase 9 n=1 Tax=Pistacia vera TaxID=55513 RepID=UPI0012635833|nr:probable carboxylesterase 9 [Pistacia vera]XP_031267783.1 probable carboxylesterase 9 [Pistacia vera]
MSKSNFDPYAHLGIVFNPDGSITRRLSLPKVEPNPDPVPDNPTVSKDIIINPKTNTCIRIFRPVKIPSNDNTVARLPIIIYFHGGGFILYSACDVVCNQNCSLMASEIPAIVVSVDYRLAPDHRLPACYEDAVDAILWVKQQAVDPEGEKWIKNFGDLSRCYLGGRGNGANIVFHAALRAMDYNLGPMEIRGLLFNQPLFGGVQRTKSEIKLAADPVLPLQVLDVLWDLSLPKGADRDHRFSNPILDGPHKIKISSLPRSLVIGFCGDPTIDRQQQFVQLLELNGVHVEAQFNEVGFHAVDVVDKRRALAVLKMTKDFIF